MTEREAFEAWARAESSGDPCFESAAALWSFKAWQASRKQALEEERAKGCRVADALRELLSDTQHKEHPDCDDDGWCPVRDGRRALEEYDAETDAIRSLSTPSL